MASSMMELISRTSVLSDSVTTSVATASESGAMLLRLLTSSCELGRAAALALPVTPLRAAPLPLPSLGVSVCTL